MVKNVKGDINWTGNHVFSNNITNVYINAALDGYATPINATGDGYVSLFADSKTITQDGYFYFDRTRKRLGIGTASPQSTLHVVSDGYTLMQLSASSGGSGVLAMQGRPVAATATQTFTINPSGSSSWSEKTISIGNQPFQGLDQSDDGKYILAATFLYSSYGQVALSSNYGQTFNEVTALQLSNTWWFDACVDADGSHMAVISMYSGTSKLYISSDYGATWVDRTSATGLSNFWCIDMDDDGSHIVVCARAEGGPLKLSTDGGATWTTKAGAGTAMASGYPESCAISGDGTKILVLTDYYTSRMIYSTDTGANWNYSTHSDGGAFGEKMAAMSRDGTVMLAITNVYNGVWVSTNSGSSWTQYSISSGYSPTACSVSADGTKMLIATNGSKVFYSSNTGATWSDNTPPNPGYNWYKGISISRDGSIRLAMSNGVYTTLYMHTPPFRYLIGNTALSNNDFSYGGNLEASIDNIVTAFNNKSGKNSTAVKIDGYHIKYTANTAGSAGNLYSTLELKDTSNSFYFDTTTMSGGLDAAGFLQSNGYINLGTSVTPSSGYSDLGDVVAGGDLEVKGNLKVGGTTVATIAGGTTGNIQYNNGSGILAGETNLFWDATNDRLGLATTSPQNRLDVKGAMVIGSSYGGTNTAPSDGLLVQGKIGVGTTSVGSDGLLDVVSSSSNSGIIIRNDAGDTTSHSVLIFKGRSSSGTGIINSYIRYKNTTSDPKLFIAVGNNMGVADGNDLFTFTRAGAGDIYRFGIGTSSPSLALDVAGNAKIGAQSGSVSIPSYIQLDTSYCTTDFTKLKFYLFNNAPEYYGFGLGSSSNLYIRAGNATTGKIQFVTANTERMVVDNSGNVGIGISSPASGTRLEISDSSNALTRVDISNSTYTTSSITGFRAIMTHASDGGNVCFFQYGKTYSGNIFGVAAANTSCMTSWAASKLIVGTANNSAPLHLMTNGTIAATIDASQKVGIGNASPGALLHVGAGADSPASTSPAVYITNAGTTILSIRDATNDVETSLESNSFGGVLSTQTNHKLYFNTNQATRMTIDTGGKVGIGQTSPSATLDIVGDLEVNGNIWNPALKTALDGYASVSNTEATGDGYLSFFTGIGRNLAGDNDLWYNRANGDLMVGGGGYIGIGTSNPVGPIDIWCNSSRESEVRISTFNEDHAPGYSAVHWTGETPTGSNFFLYAWGPNEPGYEDNDSLVPFANAVTLEAAGSSLLLFGPPYIHLIPGGNLVATATYERNFGIGTIFPIERLTVNGTIALQEQSVSSAYQDGYGKLYAKSDGYAYYKSGVGTEYNLTRGSGGYLSTPFTSQTSVSVTHNFGVYPIVQVINDSYTVIDPQSIVHDTVNGFTVTFSGSTSGTIIARA